MPVPGSQTRHRAVLLLTTFPVLSETFLQREVECFGKSKLRFELVSLWGGAADWRGLPIRKHGLTGLLAGLLWVPYWLIRKPRICLFLIGQVWRPRTSGLLNWAENLLGLSYAFRSARFWEQSDASHFHAVWASAPGMAAWGLSSLSGRPFSVSGHAYDLFEKGGDGWLERKAGAAEWIRTSTHAGKLRWEEKGARPDKVIVVRRGLPELPPYKSPVPIRMPCRVLSVGRMVEKMGFDRQIPVYQQMKEAGIGFSVEWIGDGPERPALEKAVERAGLSDTVHFRGRLPYEAVEEAYQENQIFVFTGRVDSRGDRAGLPNAVAEAMAWGLLVFATDVGAVREAVKDEFNGAIWEGAPEAGRILELLNDRSRQETYRTQARAWAEAHYQLSNNLGPLIARLSL